MTKMQRTGSAKPTAEAAPGSAPRPSPKAKKTTFATGDLVLVVGLGNPGASYARNRHNIGFMALDEASGRNGFGAWRSKFQSEMAEGRIAGKRVVLLKPQTYMNESGRAVGEACRFLKVRPEDVIVVHDELDLAPGKCRVKTGGGHAGHNGLRSIHAHIGADYARVRLGIGHPGDKNKVSGYVLHDFAKAEEAWLDPLLTGFSDGFAKLIQGDDAGFQNAVAIQVQPQRKTTQDRPEKATGKPAPYAARAASRKKKEAAKRVEKVLEEAKPDNPLARLLAKFSR